MVNKVKGGRTEFGRLRCEPRQPLFQKTPETLVQSVFAGIRRQVIVILPQ